MVAMMYRDIVQKALLYMFKHGLQSQPPIRMWYLSITESDINYPVTENFISVNYVSVCLHTYS